MKLIKALLLSALVLFANLAIAGEGMWLPLLLKALNEAEMQSMGMKMTAEDIYSVNKGSLKDAIVHFNGGCTSEIISNQGLLLTNHHCGYGQIQSHSSLENNYLKNGFWAMSQAEELANPNLSATFIVRIEDISKKILSGVTDDMATKDRQSVIDKNIEALKASTKLAKHEEMSIKPFYKGNQYFMFVTMTYRDVRLVGAPPESIGKFGSDTDNWVWPRHTGDFALFRIYAGKDNMPADYSEDNVPYKPKHSLPISLDGVAEDDFTLVFGFPGRTNQYLPSFAVEQIVDVLNPAKIGIRDRALKIVDAEMRADEEVRIQYASKFARIANYWKKWIGESQGLKSTKGIAKKKAFEKDFLKKVKNDRMASGKYGNILSDFEKLYKEIEPYAHARDYYSEVFSRNIELLQVTSYLNRLVKLYEENGEEGYNSFKGRLAPFLQRLYKNYRPSIDQKVFAALTEMYAKDVGDAYLSDMFKKELASAGNDYSKLASSIYGNTMITNGRKMMSLFEEAPADAVKKLKEDPAFLFGKSMADVYNEKVSKKYNELNTEISDLQRQYMKALIEIFPDERFYPDANSTMRVTYGKVNGYEPKDAVYYQPVTYLSGVMQKYVPGDYEFDVPKKLLELYDKKDYGQYADNGKMPVCFIGSNHTTGGNSGSPAIDAHGNLIGLNFDRVWEGTMSDINYDASICRNIMVDARYILFIIDKYAGAGHLIKEMNLVHPKKKK